MRLVIQRVRTAAARTLYPKVSTGAFQSHMLVALENDGPVTFVL